MDANQIIKPQEGPQEDFLATSADIAIYGGAAGGGKSYALLLEPLRHMANPDFGAVIFRRTTKQVRNEGGLWDTASKFYIALGFDPLESRLELVAPTKMRVQFAHLEYEKNIYDWQGSQIPFIGFDELTHFTQKQFFYLLSRNRSTCGIKPYIRATTNPDPKSWVRKFIAWWIDEETGLPIKERSGVVRWFVRVDDKLHWADSAEELRAKFDDVEPKSATFIPSKLEDNKILMEKDPGYRANLMAQSKVERARLLDGNWNAMASAGEVFKREWFEVVEAAPADVEWIRYWDRAATEVKEGQITESKKKKDPDWTAGVKIGRSRSTKLFYVAHVARDRVTPLKVERMVKNTAIQDMVACAVGIEQDPGQAGVADAQNYVRLLAGFVVKVGKPTTDKVTRALPASAQAEAGNIKVLRGDWNEDFFDELENFPEGGHDDQVDGLTGGFNMLTSKNVGSFGSADDKTESTKPMAGSLGASRVW